MFKMLPLKKVPQCLNKVLFLLSICAAFYVFMVEKDNFLCVKTAPHSVQSSYGNRTTFVTKQLTRTNSATETLVGFSDSGVSAAEHYNSEVGREYVQQPADGFCKDVDLLIMIKSSRNHSQQRDVIRHTWASVHNVSSKTIRAIFLLGIHNPDQQNGSLTSELKTHQDLLVGDFVDSYENLTIKSSMGLKWFAESCRSPAYVILGDDDTIMSLSHIARVYLANPPAANVLHCGDKVIRNARVKRKGRWSISSEIYPNLRFPPYCNGPCFIMSRDVTLAINDQLMTSPIDITVDDALLTGIVREKIGLQLGTVPRGFCRHLTNSPLIIDKILKAWNNSNS